MVRTGACTPVNAIVVCGFAPKAEDARSGTVLALFVNPLMRKYSITAALVERLGKRSLTRVRRCACGTIGSRETVPNEAGVPLGRDE